MQTDIITHPFYSGFVSLIGRPNVGKSTLLNCLAGEKVAIVSGKPQTTRNTIRAVLTGEDYQIVLIDTPGIHQPKSKLGQYMVKSAESAFEEMDVILFLTEPKKPTAGEMHIIEKLASVRTPVFLVINKIDTVPKGALLEITDQYRELREFAEIIPVSALLADNTEALVSSIRKRLLEGPKYFPGDILTDQPERLIAAEIIREKALHRLEEEIPHGIAVEIQKMQKRKGKTGLVDVEATIYCDRASHKGMIIGKNGSKLKEIGSLARADLETLLGSPVFLELWVKVKKDWRDSDFLLKSFGYTE